MCTHTCTPVWRSCDYALAGAQDPKFACPAALVQSESASAPTSGRGHKAVGHDPCYLIFSHAIG